MEQNTKKLFIGLDVGTDSVGWAATDEYFNLYRLKGKTAWGARLFLDAANAKDRRQHRVSGRRLARRKERIRLLNALFDPLLKKVDPTFLLRLESSTLQNDDQNKDQRAVSDALLFGNKKDEKAYYAAFPTIWHLRKALIENDDKAFSDIRYLYLAIHHIIKYRGNFLRQGEIKIGEFDFSCFDKLNQFFDIYFSKEDEEEVEFIGLSNENYQRFIDCAADKNLGKGKKKGDLLKLMSFSEDEKPFCEMFCSLCAGLAFSTKKLNKKDETVFEDIKVEFNGKFDDKQEEIKSVLGDAYDLVELAKFIFDYCDLKDILGASTNLSEAFAGIYDSHKDELKALKGICREIDRSLGNESKNSLYREVFNDKGIPNNYAAFIHHETNSSRCGIADFNNYVLQKIEPLENLLSKQNYKNWIQLKQLASQGRLLQTIAIRSTSIIPMQLHLKDLKLILANAEKRDIPGIKDIKEKILLLFQFKVPYYCGPLTDRSQYSNVVLKAGTREKITPWNFADQVDLEETKKKFMEGLTNKCTYLKDCNVLPRQSLMFQEYDAWNKLNNLSINGNKPSPEEMNALFDFASKRRKTTMSDIKKFEKRATMSKENDVTVSGWNENDFIDLSSFVSLSGFFDLGEIHSADYMACEEAILLKTIFTDAPQDADPIIAEKFPNLKPNQLAALKKMSCKGWATLSREFLTLKAVDADGEVMNETLLGLMKEGKGNLMQLLHSSLYNFQDVIDSHNRAVFGDKSPKQIANDLIEEMPPQMRRPVIQALRIVREVSKVAKKQPDVISIEVTRESNDKKKKEEWSKKATDRKKQIDLFLKNLKKTEDVKQTESELDGQAINDIDSIRGKHLYLYFLQNGKDAYTGLPIDINDVLNGTKYDTDHIIPQSLMKDDSIDNLVLVNREKNQHKSNEFPLPRDIQTKANIERWRALKKAGGMSEKKFNNLTRTTPLTEEELSAFVAAQINVVNRSNVVIRDALKILYPNAKLIFSKAQYPSQIRRDLEIPKLRDLNDTHHAVDAFLNIVSGVELTKQFGRMDVIKAAAKGDKDHSLNMTRYLERLLKKVDENKNETMTELGNHVFVTSQRHDFLLTYRFDYQDSAFYNATIYSPDKNLIPMHDGMDPERYGGYSSAAREYNCVATIKGKKKTTRYLLGVPHLLVLKAKSMGVDITPDLIGLVPHKEGEEVLVDWRHPIPLSAVIKKDGVEYLLASYNVNQVNLYPFSPIFLSNESSAYLHALAKVVEKGAHQNEKEWTAKANRKGSNQISFGFEKSLKVAEELFTLAANQKYNYCPMVSKLGYEETKKGILQKISEGSLMEQYKELRALLSRFTRKSFPLSGKYFPKGRGSLLQDDLKIVSKSITGLYETERNL